MGKIGLVCVALVWMAGCATRGAGGRRSPIHPEVLPSDSAQGGSGFGFLEQEDGFQRLQQSAGLEHSSWHEPGQELETGDARALWEALARTRTTLDSFGPRRSLLYLLRQVLARGKMDGKRVWAPDQLLETSPASTGSSAWEARGAAGHSEGEWE